MIEYALEKFIEQVTKQQVNLFGINVWQRGEVIAQHYCALDEPRNIYSASKSFAASAVGILIDECLLSVDDRPVDYFKEHLTDKMSAGYEKLNLGHLLTMSSGHRRALLHEDERNALQETDWIRFIFSQPLVSVPGEKFVYSNASTYLAGCMAQKAAGAKLVDFLYERMFAPMNIAYPQWEECPIGYTFGASRLRLKLSDMMKLGVLYLQGGRYQGKQIVSERWVKEATTFKIASDGADADQRYGYGYQFWLCRHMGVYMAYGRKGQYVIVIPEKDAVIATSADEDDSQKLLNIIWDTIYTDL